MSKLLIGPIPLEGEKMIGREWEWRKKKREKKRKDQRRKNNNQKKNQSIKGIKKRGRQKSKIEVSPRDRGEQNSFIPTTILERSRSIHLESPQILQGLATPVLQQLPSTRPSVFYLLARDRVNLQTYEGVKKKRMKNKRVGICPREFGMEFCFSPHHQTHHPLRHHSFQRVTYSLGV